MLGQILAHGGITLVLIGMASVLALAVVIERCWRLLPQRQRFPSTLDAFQQDLTAHGLEAARARLLETDDGMARVLLRGSGAAGQGDEAIRVAALEAAQREVSVLERGLGILQTIAQVAPLMGLFGTVAGLMEAFQAAGAADAVTHQILATGIFKALGTTAAGLAVAIPSAVAYASLAGVAHRLLDHLEFAAAELPVLLAGRRP
jgi:biopolymer transport protein ExbB